MTFEEWMESTGLSKSSIEKYVGAIDGPLTSWALSYRFISGSIRGILDPVEFSVVSEKIAATPEYGARNKRGHHMYGAALKKYAGYLVATAATRNGGYADGPCSQEMKVFEAAEDFEPFIPQGQEDAREKVLREVVRRRGQPKFRSTLIDAYESRCAITGCTVLPILEAAHITPYLGPATNLPSNGLLLRADIHTLWDLGLMAIDPDNRKVWISPKVADDAYQDLTGVQAFQPKERSRRPSHEALNQQWKMARNAMKAD